MNLAGIAGIFSTAVELGLLNSIVVLSLYLSYRMLNVCDLSTDGCFTLGAAVGAVVALSGHPFLSIPAAMAAGMLSGFVTSLLQTKMGIDSLLSGIIVNTGLYSVNIAVMGGSSILNMNKTSTVFTVMKGLLKATPLKNQFSAVTALLFVAAVVLFLSRFLRTRLGLAIRATGNNPDMVSSSSIDPHFTTIVGLCISGSLTALSGCLLAQSQKAVNIDIGSGMVTIALASLLIGGIFNKKGGITRGALMSVFGALIFRGIYALALRFKMPAYMLKLISSCIVMLAIFLPQLKERIKGRVRRPAAGPGTGSAETEGRS